VLGLEDADGLARLCTDCGLVNIILAKHGCMDFDTYIRGSKVLDYFLIPPELEDAVLACGYEPYNIRTMGDHRAFYVDFDTTKLLGGKPTFANAKASRDINSKKYHQIPIYCKHRIKHLEKHKFFKQLEELQKCIDTDTPNDWLAQKLDHRFHRSAKHAGKKCPQYPRAPYSPKIAKMCSPCATDVVSLPKTSSIVPLEVNAWRKPYVLSEQGSPNWVKKIPASRRPKNTSLASKTSSSSSSTKTQPQDESHPVASPSSWVSSECYKTTQIEPSPTQSLTSPVWRTSSSVDQENIQVHCQ